MRILTTVLLSYIILSSVTAKAYTDHFDTAEKKLSFIEQPVRKKQLQAQQITAYILHKPIQEALPLLHKYEQTKNYPHITQMAHNLIGVLSREEKLDLATTIIKGLKTTPAKDIFREYKAYSHIQKSQFKKAKRTAQYIKDPRKKDLVLSSLARHYIQNNQLKEGLKIQRLILSEKEKKTIQNEQIIHAVKHKKIKRVFALINQSRQPKKKIQVVLRTLTKHKVELSEDQWLMILENVKSPRSVFLVQQKLAEYYIQHGEDDKAYQVVNNILDTDIQAETQVTIIKFLVQNAQFDKAAPLIDYIQQSRQRDQATIALAVGYAIHNNPEESIRVLNNLTHANLKESAFIKIGAELGKTDNYHYAQLLINQISPQVTQDKMKKAYLVSASKNLNPIKLNQLIDSISNASIRNDCVHDILTTHTFDTSVAQKLLSRITHPRTKATTIMALLKAQKNEQQDPFLFVEIESVLQKLFPKSFQSKYILRLLELTDIKWPKFLTQQFGSILKHNFARTKTDQDNRAEKEQAILFLFKSGQFEKAFQILNYTPLDFQTAILFQVPPLEIDTQYQASKYKKLLSTIKTQ